MKNRTKNLMIGLFVIAAIAGIIVLILFLKPTVGDGEKSLQVRFSNIAGIGIGTRVTLAGRPVGEVRKISPIKDARYNQVDELGRVYFYQLTLSLDSSVNVFNTDEIAVETTGLLGDKSIAIIPKAPQKGQKPKLLGKNAVVYADSVEPLENALFMITNLAKRITGTVENLDEWFVENRNELTRAVRSFSNAMEQIDLALQELNEQKVMVSLKKALSGFAKNMDVLYSILSQADQLDIMRSLDEILANFVSTTKALDVYGPSMVQNFNMIMQDIASGEGTIGKLIKSDGLYMQVTSILSKVSTLMNDVNHYGILFQYDKQWQRKREKRATLLTSLKNPGQFKKYFEGEIDNITTSLARVSMLLEKAKESPEKEAIYQSTSFKREFIDLLKDVERLNEQIKWYNESIMDERSS